MFTGMLHTHKLVVTLFLLLYIVKTVLLLLNKKEALLNFTKKTRIIEMICSVGFLVTGIFLANNSGNITTFFWIKIICVALSIPIAVIAFKRFNKVMAVVALLLIVAAYGLAEMGKKGKETTPSEFTNVAHAELGKEIYNNKCITCHGVDGKLGLSGAKDLSTSILTHDEKIAIVKNGKNSMMSFNGQLDEGQIEAVVEYVEQFK